MEEKERYISKKIIKDVVMPDGLYEIKDRESDFYLIIENKKDVDTITNLLNQQDKRIKELETIIFEKPSKKRINFDKWKELYLESQQLKQELKDERAELQQLYSHLEVEAFGEDIQEQAVKEIDKIKEENKQLKQQLEEYKTYKDWQDILCCKSAQEVIDFVMSNYLTEDEKCRTIADLKQQLHDLPKKIVGEFKEKIKNIKENIWSHYGKHELINDVDYGKICELNKLLRNLDQVKGESNVLF